MQSKKIFYVFVTVSVVIIGTVFLLGQNSYKTELLENTPLGQPIFLSVEEVSSPSPEQQREIVDFKKKVLARVTSSVPLTEKEKSVIAMSIATTRTLPFPGGTIVANQDVYRFTKEELEVISVALEK